MNLENPQSSAQPQSGQKYFSAGCDMWILINDPESYWWKQINFFSGFLLSSLNQKLKSRFTNSISQEAENILSQTNLPRLDYKIESNIVYLCVQNHFQTRWICLVSSAQDLGTDELLKNLKNLKKMTTS